MFVHNNLEFLHIGSIFQVLMAFQFKPLNTVAHFYKYLNGIFSSLRRFMI